jgi:hypothetical protein
MPRGGSEKEVRDLIPEHLRHLPLLSYSQLSTVDRCQFLWFTRYTKKLKLDGKKKPRLDCGNFVHMFLEDLYTAIAFEGMTQAEWLAKRMTPCLMKIIDGLTWADQATEVATAMQIVTRYVESSDVLEGHTPVGKEEHFFVLVTLPDGRQFILQGYVDLITIDAQNRIWVWDHKSPAKLWPRMRGAFVMQLVIYLILLRADGLNVHGTCINQLNSFDYKELDKQTNDKLFNRKFYTFNPIEIQNFWNEFLALAAEALNLIEGRTVARRSIRDEDCFKCDAAIPCRASLGGAPLDEAFEDYNAKQAHWRGIEAGSSVVILD